MRSEAEGDQEERGTAEQQLAQLHQSMELLEGIQSNYARLVDQLMAELEAEKAKSDALLRNILPESIIARLQNGETDIADRFDDVAVVFCDLVDFTGTAARLGPSALVASLNEIFLRFDRLCEAFGVEKIKTIGDAYLAAAGLPVPNGDPVTAGANLALGMRSAVAEANAETGTEWQIRIGLNSGPAVAGIIGSHKYAYDVWGDTVNLANRLQTAAQPGQILVPASLTLRLNDQFEVRTGPELELKGKGHTSTMLLEAPRIGDSGE